MYFSGIFNIFLILIFFLFSGSSALPLFLDAGGKTLGTAAVPFLKTPTGARAVAMAGADLFFIDDPSAAFWNPAAAAYRDYYEFYFTNNELFPGFGVRQDYAAYINPLTEKGAFGFHANVLTTGTIESRNASGNPAGDIRPLYDMDIGGMFAWRNFSGNFAAGIQAKYIRSTIFDITGQTAALDIGTSWEFIKGLRTGAVIYNAGLPITYVNTPERLPYGAAAGLSWRPETKNFTTAFSARKFYDSPYTVSAGGEYTLNDMIDIRAGYEFRNSDDKQGFFRNISAGVGINEKKYSINAAYSYKGSILRHSYLIDLVYRFQEIIPLKAEDYLNHAMLLFRKEEYKESIEKARSALRKNPNLHKARDLIKRADAMMKISDGRILSIIYTGGVEGSLLPPGGGLGGAARAGGLISELKRRNPFSVSADAGNYINKSADSLKRKLLLTTLARIPYDAVNIGEGEFSGTLFALDRDYIKAGIKAVNCNIDGADVFGSIERYRLVNAGGKYNMLLIGAITPSIRNRPDNKSVRMLDLKKEIGKALASDEAGKADLKVLLFGGGLAQSRKIAENIDGIDLIIASGARLPTYSPINHNGILIVSAGEKGRFVGEMQFNFSGNKITYGNKMYSLGHSVPEDVYIKKLLQNYKEGTDSPLPELSNYTPKKHNYLYYSDFSGDTSLYVKVANEDMHIKIDGFERNEGRPVFSPQRKKIIFTVETDFKNRDNVRSLMCYDLLYNTIRTVYADSSLSITDYEWAGGENFVYFIMGDKGEKDIYLADIYSEALINITNSKKDEEELELSPDMQVLAYTVKNNEQLDIMLSDPRGGGAYMINKKEAKYRHLRWSRGGSILSAIKMEPGKSGKSGDLYLFDMDRDNGTFVTRNAGIMDAEWLDDNTAVLSYGTDFPDLALFSAETGVMRPLITGMDNKEKRYGEIRPLPVGCENGANGVIIFERINAGENNGVYSIRRDGSFFTRPLRYRGNTSLPD